MSVSALNEAWLERTMSLILEVLFKMYFTTVVKPSYSTQRFRIFFATFLLPP